MSKKGSVRVHIYLHRKRVEFLQREYPKLGYSAIINRLLHSHELKIKKSRAAQESLLDPEDLLDLEEQDERPGSDTKSS